MKQKVRTEPSMDSHVHLESLHPSHSKKKGTTARSEVKAGWGGLVGRKLSSIAKGQESLSEWKKSAHSWR